MKFSHYVSGVRRSVREMRAIACHRSRIAFLNTRWDHHARASGYSPIAEGLGPNVAPSRLIPRVVTGTCQRIWKEPNLDEAIHVALAMRLAGASVLDIVDGDHKLGLAKSLTRMGACRCFATFHQCVDRLAELVRSYPSGIIDGAICVSRCQIPIVRRLARHGRCWYLPHGVNTDYFCPGNVHSGPANFLCVGVHRRDLHTLGRAARIIKAREPHAVVRLVSPRNRIPSDVDLTGVDLACDVSDELLLEFYQRATALLLPLEEATANNSILEGIACGLPVVTTDVGGVRDYTTPECAILCRRGDAAGHANAALAILSSPTERDAMALAARDLALTFSWPRIREQLRTILSGSAECEDTASTGASSWLQEIKN